MYGGQFIKNIPEDVAQLPTSTVNKVFDRESAKLLKKYNLYEPL